jgi:hypothetical protein
VPPARARAPASPAAGESQRRAGRSSTWGVSRTSRLPFGLRTQAIAGAVVFMTSSVSSVKPLTDDG